MPESGAGCGRSVVMLQFGMSITVLVYWYAGARGALLDTFCSPNTVMRGATLGFEHLLFSLSHILTHSLSLVLVVMM